MKYFNEIFFSYEYNLEYGNSNFHLSFLNVHVLNVYIFLTYQPISIMVRVFTNGQGDWGSIPGEVISKSLKMAHDVSIRNTQHFKVQIKG